MSDIRTGCDGAAGGFGGPEKVGALTGYLKAFSGGMFENDYSIHRSHALHLPTSVH